MIRRKQNSAKQKKSISNYLLMLRMIQKQQIDRSILQHKDTSLTLDEETKFMQQLQAIPENENMHVRKLWTAFCKQQKKLSEKEDSKISELNRSIRGFIQSPTQHYLLS